MATQWQAPCLNDCGRKVVTHGKRRYCVRCKEAIKRRDYDARRASMKREQQAAWYPGRETKRIELLLARFAAERKAKRAASWSTR